MSDATGSAEPLRDGAPGQDDTVVLPHGAPAFAPTDLVPAQGLPAWDVPDPTRSPVAQLDPQLPVQVTDRRQDGWTHVVCSNGWTTWVDGRLLVPRDDLADDDELWSTLHAALAEYGELVDQLASGAIDSATFGRRALGVGLIVREHDAWILDLPTKRWWRYDGMSLSTIGIEELASGGR